MKIYAVVVTYNGSKYIWKCVNSIINSSIDITPVIVDNNSTDNTIELIKNEFPNVVLHLNNSNEGFGQANNKGIKYALENSADFVLLLNQDAYLYKNTVEDLLNLNDENSILSPIHLDGTGIKLDQNFKCYLFNNQENNLLDDLILKRECIQKYEVNFVNAACWLVPRKILKEIGGFNPLFFHYGEDVNYAHRMKFHKRKMYIVNGLYVEHDREKFGNKKMAVKKQLYRELLLLYTNINSNSKEIILKNIHIFLRLSYFFFSFQWKKLLFQIYEIGVLTFAIPKIVKSRRIEMNVGNNWIKK